MKIGVIKKEFTDEDVKAFRKTKKRVPAWLYERPEGTQIRIKDEELGKYSKWVEEYKPKPKRSTKKSTSAPKSAVSGSSE